MVTFKSSSFLSICSWNVGGLISKSYNKLEDPEFIKQINSYDIAFLSETHTGFETHIGLDGFQHIQVCRPVSRNNRYYGGLAILIRKPLRSGIKVLKNTSSEYQWIKLMKHFFNFEKDLYICFSYVSPCSFRTRSDSDTLEAIIRDINNFKNEGNILLCGDLNARTGSAPDFIQGDSDKHIPFDPSYIIDTEIKTRCSEDNKLDDRGKQLNDLCISSGLRILNGRSLGDLFGKFTCQTPNGASVVDYVISSEELLKDVIYFHVHPFLPLFSDCRSKVSVTLKATFTREISHDRNTHMPGVFKWNKFSSEFFLHVLQRKETSDKVASFMNKEFDTHETDIDNACSLFEDIIQDAAQKSLTRKTPSKSKKMNKKWYDEDLHVKRRIMNTKAKHMFQHPFDVSVRNNYYKHYREYRKLLKFKKKHFTKNLFSKLDDLESSDPKTYWNLVNSLKNENNETNGPESNIDTSTWYEYFQNLNSIKSKFNAKVENLNQILSNSNNIKTFNLLDTIIKDKEILNSISKLKNNKASGLDTIRNEMLKIGASTFLPCLKKLFNLIFSSGFYPSSWAMGYISPIFKTGDNSKPDNYRGITITSNIGKLFNMVLNNRLDTFLEENQVITNVQIGFTKNARTSDHMFVLKSLIDKYTNMKGGKLYTCFVDFQKAFDSVIHPGLQVKLRELNINGKFYDIISNLYTKSKLCVRLGEHRTEFF